LIKLYIAMQEHSLANYRSVLPGMSTPASYCLPRN
jgi:hypothetical protein